MMGLSHHEEPLKQTHILAGGINSRYFLNFQSLTESVLKA